MKLKYTFIVNQVADKFVAVAVGAELAEFNGFIKMNDTGKEIFELLNEETTVDAVIAAMAEKHPEETVETVTEVVNGFVQKLQDEDVLA